MCLLASLYALVIASRLKVFMNMISSLLCEHDAQWLKEETLPPVRDSASCWCRPLMFIVGGNGHACLMAVQSWTLFLKTDFSEVSGTVNHSWCCLSGCGCSRQLQRSWKGLSSWEGQAGSFSTGLWACPGFGLAPGFGLDSNILWNQWVMRKRKTDKPSFLMICPLWLVK